MHKGTSSQERTARLVLLGIVVLGVGLKAILLAVDAFPFHADEAVVGLMARHIVGGEWAAFFYGQAYMGSLDAALVALLYQLSGQASVGGIRLVQIVLYGFTMATAMQLAWAITADRTVTYATGLLLAVPAVNLTLYTTVSLGGYGEALLLGNLQMLSALAFSRRPERTWLVLAWAALAGFGLWVFGITLVFSLPTGVLVARSLLNSGPLGGQLRTAALMLLAAAAGAAPWLWSAFRQGPQAFVAELLGSAIAGASPAGFIEAAASHSIALGLFGPTVIIGLRPPWSTELLALPLAPIAIGFWLLAGYHGLRALKHRDRLRPVRWMLLGVAAATLVGLVITPFGADPSGRYFLPLAVPMALAGGAFLSRLPSARLAWSLLAAVLAFHLWGTLQSAAEKTPGITTQFNPETRVDAAQIPALAERLLALGETRGYTTYWIAYPLAFHSDERVIFVPRLPYHRDFRYTARDNRYAPYNGMVESSLRVAYITFRHAELDQRIRSGLERAGVGWREFELDGFRVFHQLSAPVRPEALGLETQP